MTVDAATVGRRVLRLEGEAVLQAGLRLDGAFAEAVALLAEATRVVVAGIGKSGLIAQKIAATLTSTGTPAIPLHPVESLHGDLGLVDPGAVAILLSKSGETEELHGLLHALARLGVPIIAITGGVQSTLARAARVVLDASVREEACPHDLAPTTSTTVALALGDALAVALLEMKGFRAEDFAQFHPGGRLGRRLLLRVRDVMTVPGRALLPTSPMREVVMALAHGRGLAVLTDQDQVVGVISAGDLTRLTERQPDFLHLAAADVMTRQPQLCHPEDLGAAVVGRMERGGFSAAPVADEAGRLVGIVHLHDLLRAGAA